MPDLAHQAVYCLSAAHGNCPFYTSAQSALLHRDGAEGPQRSRRSAATRRRTLVRILPWAALAVAALIVVMVYARDTLQPAADPVETPSVAAPVSPSPSPIPAATATLRVTPRTLAPTIIPEPGSRVLALAPKEGDVGWFSSGENRGDHLGDSFLYAGYFSGQAFISALRIELGSVPRGAPIREATLRLTGLNDDRFNPAAGGAWTVQLLATSALPNSVRATFQDLLNAPAAVTLVPVLYPADLGAGQPNTWVLDAAGRAWLTQQLLDGVEAVILRVGGPAGGEDTLFAWDSGAGPATLGEGPQLVLNLGAAPPTPPPLPTEAVIVATLTATPLNVLTAAADAWTATAVARATGTYTPLPYRVVTPTPSPANLATVQAIALLRGLPPVVPDIPTPANQATANVVAQLATAQAFLTGTATATPQGAVTPVVLTPTPGPTNVFTAAARYLAATAAAAESGTPTPWPYNAVVATPSPAYLVITFTPPPANAATAQAESAYATAVALVIGTFTPLPPNAATPTPAGFAPQATAAPSAGGPGCPDPRVQISSPTAGQVVPGAVVVYGTAFDPAFSVAILEVAGGSPPTGEYTEFGRFTFPIRAGLLGWTDTPLSDGIYTLRLTVTDQAGNTLPACEVAIRVQG